MGRLRASHALVLCKTIPTVDALTDQQVKEWIRSRGRVSDRAVDSQVADALARAKIKQSKADPGGVVLQFSQEK